MARRAHFQDVLWGKRGDGAPVVASSATVAVYETGTTEPVGFALYAGPTGSTVLANPLVADASGGIEFWTDEQRRFDLFISKAGYASRTVTADSIRAVQPYVVEPDGWNDEWESAKAGCDTVPAWWALIGDSLGHGASASDWNGTSHYALLRADLRAKYGNYADFIGPADSLLNVPQALGALSWVINDTGHGVVSSNGGAFGAGVVRWGAAPVSDPAATYTSPTPCTDLDIIYGNPFAIAGSTWTYSVDGGPPVTVTLPAGSATQIYRESISGLALGIHTITFRSQSVLNALYPYGVVSYPAGRNGAGIGSVKGASAGMGAYSWIGNNVQPKPAYRAWQGYTASGTPTAFGIPAKPSLAVIALSINDMQALVPPVQYERGLQLLCQALRRGVENCSILMVAHYVSDGISSDLPAGFTNPENHGLYVARMKAVADIFGCAFVNFHAKWGSAPAANGYVASNGTHPIDGGHFDIYSTLKGLLV